MSRCRYETSSTANALCIFQMSHGTTRPTLGSNLLRLLTCRESASANKGGREALRNAKCLVLTRYKGAPTVALILGEAGQPVLASIPNVSQKYRAVRQFWTPQWL